MNQIALPLFAAPAAAHEIHRSSSDARPLARTRPAPGHSERARRTWRGGTQARGAAAPSALDAELDQAREAFASDPGFEIGWDHAHYRLTPPAEHLHAGNPVHQGWAAGRAAFGARTLRPTRHVRRSLFLRLQAWLRGESFEPLVVNPRYLALIEPERCPVTGEPLTFAEPFGVSRAPDVPADGVAESATEGASEGAADITQASDTDAKTTTTPALPAAAPLPTDAVVMRLRPGAEWEAGQLVTVSRRVAQACGQADLAAVRAVRQRLMQDKADPAPSHGAGAVQNPGGLNAGQWQRLEALLSLAQPQPHARVASLPLVLLPPPRLQLVNPAQALQALLTRLFCGPAYARRLTDIGALMPHAEVRRTYFLFMHALLARRMAAGVQTERAAVRSAMEACWTHPLIQRRWEQLVLRLTCADCERIVRLAVQRGLAGPGWRFAADAPQPATHAQAATA
jgi:hypothetical protein